MKNEWIKAKSREIKFRAWDNKNKKWIGKNPLEYLCVSGDVVVLVESKCLELNNQLILQTNNVKEMCKREIYYRNLISDLQVEIKNLTNDQS
ncbi:hypothetical protein LCGC14_2436420 [marine sediment metagenome]|uniref:YopX protein domain-containing protein n=1 Tax=marine sediment metagenome TaxID=412755 RepID=A0A0F9DXE9_9ZZZZ